MKIHWSPTRMDDSYNLEYIADALILDGEIFDFAALPEGATLPAAAIDNKYFVGPVERIGGEIVVHLLLPHGPNASQAALFPEVMSLKMNGAVEMPK